MPEPVSDSHDPEWCTSGNRAVHEALQTMHGKLGTAIGSPPRYILHVVRGNDGKRTTLAFTEKQWRVLRFACERAMDSI